MRKSIQRGPEVLDLAEELRKGYTPEQLVPILRASLYTVREWIRLGKLKAEKVGRRYIVTPTQLNAFLHAQK